MARALIRGVGVRLLESSLCGCCNGRRAAASDSAEAEQCGGAPAERSGNETSNCPPNSQKSENSLPDVANAECAVINGPLETDGEKQNRVSSCVCEEASGRQPQQPRRDREKSPSLQSSARSSLILTLRKRFSIATSEESSGGRHRDSNGSDYRKGSVDVCAGSRQSLSQKQQHRNVVSIPRVVILAEGQSEAESWKEPSAPVVSTDPSTPTRIETAPALERSTSSPAAQNSSQSDSTSGGAATCVDNVTITSPSAGNCGDLPADENANNFSSPSSDREQVTPNAGAGGAMGCLGQTLIQTLFMMQTLSGVPRPEQRRDSEMSETAVPAATPAAATTSSRERCNSGSQRTCAGACIPAKATANTGVCVPTTKATGSGGAPSATKSCIAGATSAASASGALSAATASSSSAVQAARSSRKASLNVSFVSTGRPDEHPATASSHSGISRTASYSTVLNAAAAAGADRCEPDGASSARSVAVRPAAAGRSGSAGDAAMQACASSLCSSASLKSKQQGRGRRWVAKCKKIVLQSSWRKTPPDGAVRYTYFGSRTPN